MPPPPAADVLEAGTPAFRRANLALAFGGFATFAMLYGTQPMLPVLGTTFGVAPATASLSVSAGTAGLAVALIPASVLADRFGRVRVMKLSLVLAAFFACASAFVSDFTQLLVLRALLGVALAGLPAAAIAHLGDEIATRAQGRAMGLYIAGTACGGMSGRFLAALVSDALSWRHALAALGLVGVVAALVFWRTLPAARHFSARPARVGALLADLARVAADPAQRALFAVALLLAGCFVALYNYLGFRLSAAPYELSASALGAVFLLYAIGSVSSAWSGRLGDRIGRRNVLWIMVAAMAAGLFVTLAGSLPVLVAGVALFTLGFFGAHTAASTWVSRRAGERRTLAAALYLCAYYLGNSLLGSVAGLAWDAGAWPGVVGLLGACLGLLMGIVLFLHRVPPLALPLAAARPG